MSRKVSDSKSHVVSQNSAWNASASNKNVASWNVTSGMVIRINYSTMSTPQEIGTPKQYTQLAHKK